MPWSLRPRLGERRWTVRLHLLRPAFDLRDGDTISGGHMVRVVRAEGRAEARRKAIAEAEADLATVLERPVVERLLWSVDEIDARRPKRGEIVGEFMFYRNPIEPLPEPLGDLVEALSANDLWLQVGDDWINVLPETDEQFRVSMRVTDEITVSTDDWHGHYEDPEQAIACFRWLLTPYYRVVCETQNGERSAVWIERWQAEGWHPLDEVIYRNPTDVTRWMGGNWVREYRQQAILHPPVPYDEIVEGARLDSDGLPPGSYLSLRTETFPRPFAEERGWLHADYDFEKG